MTAASLIVRPDGVHLFGVGDIDAETDRTATPVPRGQAVAERERPARAGADADERSKSEFFRDCSRRTRSRALVEHFAARHRRRASSTSRRWAGAYNRTPPDATAFPHRDARFLLKHTGARTGCERAYAITHPHGTGGAYVNFPDPYLEDALTAYHGPNLARLRESRPRTTPTTAFRFPQSL